MTEINKQYAPGVSMDNFGTQNIAMPNSKQSIGRVTAVDGSQASVDLTGRTLGGENPTVGKFMSLMTAKSIIIGLITDVCEQPIAGANGGTTYRKLARLDLIGEILPEGNNATRFQRGVTEYPNIGDAAAMLGEDELRMVYGVADDDHAHIGDLQQNNNIGVHIDIDHLVSRHFAILGATGVGKSSGVAIILQKILETRPNLRVFLVDPHNEYGRCFGDKANVLNPRNLRLPFWLFNFEETIDAFFGGRPGVEEEVEILAEVIPLAKGAYLQYRNASSNDRLLAKKRDPKDSGFSADTPVPYRIEDLINLLDERMGKLENRSRAMIYHKLIGRIQTFRNHPRYAFMFENANIGGDTMAEIIGALFRLPSDGKPMTVMQLAGFPAEVVELGGVGFVPHGFRLRPVERRRRALAVRLRRSAPLRTRRQEDRLRPDQARAVADRQGRPQIRRVPRPGDSAPGGNRPDHHFAVLDLVLHAPVERRRPEADPLGGVGCRRQPAVVYPVARYPRGLHLRLRRGIADPYALCRTGRRTPSKQRSLRQHPLRRRHQHESRSAHLGDRTLALGQHEPSHGRRRYRFQYAVRNAVVAAFASSRLSGSAIAGPGPCLCSSSGTNACAGLHTAAAGSPAGGLWSTASRRLWPAARAGLCPAATSRAAASPRRSALEHFEKAARCRSGRSAGGYAKATVAVQIATSVPTKSISADMPP